MRDTTDFFDDAFIEAGLSGDHWNRVSSRRIYGARLPTNRPRPLQETTLRTDDRLCERPKTSLNAETDRAGPDDGIPLMIWVVDASVIFILDYALRRRTVSAQRCLISVTMRSTKA